MSATAYDIELMELRREDKRLAGSAPCAEFACNVSLAIANLRVACMAWLAHPANKDMRHDLMRPVEPMKAWLRLLAMIDDECVSDTGDLHPEHWQWLSDVRDHATGESRLRDSRHPSQYAAMHLSSELCDIQDMEGRNMSLLSRPLDCLADGTTALDIASEYAECEPIAGDAHCWSSLMSAIVAEYGTLCTYESPDEYAIAVGLDSEAADIMDSSQIRDWLHRTAPYETCRICEFPDDEDRTLIYPLV